MSFTLRPINLDTPDDCRHIARWDADPAIRHLLMPFKDQAAYDKLETAQEIWAKRKRLAHQKAETLMILVDGEVAGSCGYEFDPPHALSVISPASEEVPRTAWFGITIGEAWARGRGIGKQVIAELERRSREQGALQAEVGVFEFNDASIRMFTGLGYRQFSKLPEFTWWQGRMWDDLRLLKKL